MSTARIPLAVDAAPPPTPVRGASSGGYAVRVLIALAPGGGGAGVVEERASPRDNVRRSALRDRAARARRSSRAAYPAPAPDERARRGPDRGDRPRRRRLARRRHARDPARAAFAGTAGRLRQAARLAVAHRCGPRRARLARLRRHGIGEQDPRRRGRDAGRGWECVAHPRARYLSRRGSGPLPARPDAARARRSCGAGPQPRSTTPIGRCADGWAGRSLRWWRSGC